MADEIGMAMTVKAPSELDILLDRLERQDSPAAKKILEMRVAMDPKAFSSQVQNVLLHRPPSYAVRFVAGLLSFEDIVQMLLDLHRQSRERALTVAAKLQRSDPRFDTLFLKRYADKDSVLWSDVELLVALDILDAVSERDRLVLGVSKFLRHANPKIRAQAAKFLARRRPYLGLITDLEREADPIVRAGLIEGLYERKEEFVPGLFRRHVKDLDHKVAGSALFGLYRIGDPGSIQLIDEMAKDSRPEFRDTSAWIMGQTGDPRFSSSLSGQLSDSNELVRKQALRGLCEMKKSLASARAQSPLHVVITRYRLQEDRQVLSATVFTSKAGRPVKSIGGTRFVLKAGGTYIREYGVEEHDCQAVINAGLILSEPPKGEESVRDEFDEGVERCLTLQRSRDTLADARLTHETHLRCYASDARSSHSILTRALEGIDFGLPNLQLIVVGAAPQTRVIDRLIEIGANVGATIHVIAVSSEWRTAELRKKVLDNDGSFRMIDPCDVAQACFEMYSALQHQYRITWEKSPGNLDLEVRADSGTGSAVYLMEESSAG